MSLVRNSTCRGGVVSEGIRPGSGFAAPTRGVAGPGPFKYMKFGAPMFGHQPPWATTLGGFAFRLEGASRVDGRSVLLGKGGFCLGVRFRGAFSPAAGGPDMASCMASRRPSRVSAGSSSSASRRASSRRGVPSRSRVVGSGVFALRASGRMEGRERVGVDPGIGKPAAHSMLPKLLALATASPFLRATSIARRSSASVEPSSRSHSFLPLHVSFEIHPMRS